MTQNWIFRAVRSGGNRGQVRAAASEFGSVGARGGCPDSDADARRMAVELDAIRARFPDRR